VRVPASSTLLVATLVATGCVSSSQRVRIECVPEQVQVYVDGRLLEDDEFEVSLRKDEPHKIFVKGAGYEPQLVVLEPRVDADGNQTLGSDAVCVEVVPLGMKRDLELHMEHDVPREP
jgi:hypothetical protein